MKKIHKLYEKMVARRRLSFEEFESLILAYGFKLDRINGSHHIFKRPGIADRVNAQPVGKDAKPYQVRQFTDMIEAYGLKLDNTK